MMARDWVIRAEALGKRYLVAHEKNALVRGLLPHLLRPRRVTPFWALRDVGFSIPRGQCVVVLGPNGAGKSTLLALLAGITVPSTGSAETVGRVAPILSLGAGFHPDLTGEENLWLNGALLGITDAQLRRCCHEIVEFAGLNGFLDAPLSTYSTGMQMRLAFAIAIHADADILLIDEVMAVGDQAFQAKCVDRLERLRRAGKTLVIAAHHAGSIERFADRALLLHHGALIADGTLDHTTRRYVPLVQWLAPTQEPPVSEAQVTVEEQLSRQDPRGIHGFWKRRGDSGEAAIEEVCLFDAEEHPVSRVESGAPLTIVVRFAVARPLPDPHIGVAVFRDDRVYCYGPNTRFDGLQFQWLHAGRYECRLSFNVLTLTAGHYHLSVAIWDTLELSPYDYHQAAYPLEITGCSSPGIMSLDHEWHVLQAPEQTRGPELIAEGPQGDQAWFRTFEPLTLTARLPAPRSENVQAIVAECRGANNGELWWASRWPVPSNGLAGRTASQRVQLHLPHLPLLTGRYQWSIGWEEEVTTSSHPTAPMKTLEVIADRLDHGLIHLAHHWELRPCRTTPVVTPVTLRA